MSPSLAKKEMAIKGVWPPPLKVSKDSHLIKKSSSPPSPTSSSSALGVSTSSITAKPPQQQRHRPVIIYTHSPKVIQTQPKDFMALVQKLTGLSRSEDEHRPKAEKGVVLAAEEDSQRNESSFVKNGKSLFDPPPLPASFLTNIPVFTPNNSADFLCGNYTDSLIFTPNLSYISSSSLFRFGENEFCDY